MLFPFPGSSNSTLSPSACKLLLILHVSGQARFHLFSLFCLDDLLLGSHSTWPLPPLKELSDDTVTGCLHVCPTLDCELWDGNLSFGNPVPCLVPDWSEGLITVFWMCVLQTEAIGGDLKRRIILPALPLLSCETSTDDFFFHVAVSLFIK